VCESYGDISVQQRRPRSRKFLSHARGLLGAALASVCS
jgi:hypothetical protein